MQLNIPLVFKNYFNKQIWHILVLQFIQILYIQPDSKLKVWLQYL